MSDGDRPGRADKDSDKEPKQPVDDLVVTHHTLQTTSGEISYTARTGRVVLREEEVKDDVFKGWQARAELSVAAYTLDTDDKNGDVTRATHLVRLQRRTGLGLRVAAHGPARPSPGRLR